MNITEQIDSQLKKYYDAFNDKNWKEFKECIDDEFTYFTDKCIIQNKEQFIDFLMRDLWQGTGYNISDLNTLISDNGDLVIACYKIEFKGTFKDEKLTVNAIETTLFCKKNEDWKILHCHTSNKI